MNTPGGRCQPLRTHPRSGPKKPVLSKGPFSQASGGPKITGQVTIRCRRPRASCHRLSMVQRFYAWSPDGLRLVYVTGRYLGHYKDHSRTGTWIWNASDKSRTRISTGGYYVSWPMFDGNVYLWDPNGERPSRVRRYDVKRQQLDVTSHKSIYFSASGSYYYHPGGGLLIPE